MEAVRTVKSIKGVDNIVALIQSKVNLDAEVSVYVGGDINLRFKIDGVTKMDDQLAFKSGESILTIKGYDDINMEINNYGNGSILNSTGFVCGIFALRGGWHENRTENDISTKRES